MKRNELKIVLSKKAKKDYDFVDRIQKKGWMTPWIERILAQQKNAIIADFNRRFLSRSITEKEYKEVLGVYPPRYLKALRSNGRKAARNALLGIS